MRKLATAAVSYSTAVFAANYLIPYKWLVLLSAILILIGISLILLREKWIRPTISVLIFFSLGLLSFYFHCQNTTLKAADFEGEIHRVQAEILKYPDVYDDYCRFEVKIGSSDLPNLKAYLYDNDKQLEHARPGDMVTLSAKVTAADTLYGERYSGYNAKDIYLKLSSEGDIELKRGGFSISTFPQHISHWLSSRIEMLFPEDTAVFMRSLMIGDKTDFYGDEALYVSMSRAGLMHIVAVSGMHISFLVSLLYHIFGRGKHSAVICIVLVWIFALVTGFGPSVVRASFMCSTMLMAPVLRRENDSVTSLSAVLALILCCNPFAATSISLQLSFAAMAGIVLLGGKLYSALNKKLGGIAKYGVVRTVLYSVSSSLSVMAFTVPLTAAHFGTVSLLSPITNLVSLWAVSAAFCGGWISCALSVIPVVGEISAWICSWFARYIFLVSGIISSSSYAVLYTQTKGIWLWICLCYVVFIVFSFVKRKGIASFLIPAALSYLMVAALIGINNKHYARKEMVNILDVGQGQCITVMTDEVTAVLDCGNMYSIDNAGTTAAARLYSRGRNQVDFLLLSHLHADHANGAVMLMESIKVHNLVIPDDYDDSDGLFGEILACAERNGTEIIRITEDIRIECGDIEITAYKTGMSQEDNERCLISRLKAENLDMLVLADSSARMQRNLAEEYDLNGINAVVVSHHGSKYSYCEELLEEISGEAAIISVGHNYYGHPSQETLEALERYGYNVYRTDIDETIEVEIGSVNGEEKLKSRRKTELFC